MTALAYSSDVVSAAVQEFAVLRTPAQEPVLIFIVLFLVILLAPIAAERLGVPGIIGLIVAGIVIGPHALGLLERIGTIQVLGEAGLLYLMFLIGLDLDRESLSSNRRDSTVVTITTFALPMIIVTIAGMSLGLSTVGALIVATAFTSHTPVTYPLVQRFGLARNRSVVATIGATLLATVGALLLFAVVVAVAVGDLGPVFWLRFTVGLGGFLLLVMRGLPRITRWFFSGLGQDRMVRFLFTLVVFFGTAALADVLGLQAIVGAFLAGLGLARFVPDGSVLRDRIDFLGNALLVPVFLVSTGMLVDPVALLTNLDRLGLGIGLTAAAYGAKALAALIAAKVLGYDRAELGLMISLTGAQAAGALAVALVAVEMDLLQDRALDAVILVILITCIISSVLASRYAPRTKRPDRKPPALGETVVVPVANPATAGPLMSIAGLLAAQDSGKVLAVSVLGFEADRDALDEHRSAIEDAEQEALARGAEASSVVRIDSSASEGVLHTIVENDGSSVLLGWKGYANAREHFFGGIIDSVLAHVDVPAMVCRTSDEPIRRVVLPLSSPDLTPAGMYDLRFTCSVVSRIARELEVPVLVIAEVTDDRFGQMLEGVADLEYLHEDGTRGSVLREQCREGDLVVVGNTSSRPGIRQVAERIAQAVPDRTVLITVPR